jgi:acyl carrier protein
VFHLGAHSLSVAQVLNRISEVFEVEVRLRDVFTHPTVEEIAILVQDAVIASAERELAQADDSAVS